MVEFVYGGCRFFIGWNCWNIARLFVRVIFFWRLVRTYANVFHSGSTLTFFRRGYTCQVLGYRVRWNIRNSVPYWRRKTGRSNGFDCCCHQDSHFGLRFDEVRLQYDWQWTSVTRTSSFYWGWVFPHSQLPYPQELNSKHHLYFWATEVNIWQLSAQKLTHSKTQ